MEECAACDSGDPGLWALDGNQESPHSNCVIVNFFMYVPVVYTIQPVVSTNFTLYTRDIVECTMYIDRLYLLSVHGQGYILDCTICTTYSVQIVHFTIQCTMYNVHCIQ